MQIKTKTLRRYGKPFVFALMLLPAIWLFYNWWGALNGLPHGLGFNPQETSNRFSGDWAIRFLILSLAVSPFAKLIRSPKPILFRRMIGLFAFFYACLHISSYLGMDLLFDWDQLWKDIIKRSYITVGMLAFLLLLPMALTSTKGMIRRLGAKNWQKLHKAVYAIGLLAGFHFIMMRKGWQLEPLIYMAIILLLLASRFLYRR